jgi:4-amino-4-deoxy-L-arabinose transferase-like glycosyltransferase
VRPPRALWIILLTSLALKLSLLGVAQDVPNFADERQYIAAALTIADDGVPTYSNPQWDEAHYPPSYPYLMGAVCLVFGPTGLSITIRVLQILMSTATVWLVFLLAERLFERRSALLSAGVWAFFPTAICYTHLFLAETLHAALVVSVAVLLLPGNGNLNGKRALAAGIVAGLASLTRSIFLPQSLLIGAWIALWGTVNRKDRRRRLQLCAVFLGGLITVILPWSIRNTLRYERFLLIDTGAANVLHLNWNMTEPWNQDIGLMGRYQRQSKEAKALGIQRRRRFVPEDPADIVALHQGEIRLALDWLKHHPRLFARHSIQRAAEFLNPTSMLIHRLRRGDYGDPPGILEETLVLSVLISTMALIVLGLAGMSLASVRSEHALVAILFLSTLVSGALLMAITRYRFPSMPLLIPFAAHVACNWRTLPGPRQAPFRWGIATVNSLLVLWIFVIYVPYNYPG